ncbi:pseudaminic acid cytidylyltransferase [Ectothiorhodospira marina]|uniref:N-acylneuraminate cytidylyltransferase n=1 Tax=Ectothiorhodospira marina TaxID=1396821 RepID=A0A1H7M384_9GAMM|nr:pseudaminic acid cytidylyltransferase [Ectothiorhodospira marina]SEL05696.1 N-acylneuraminate cytidylyltransferase [Ectothiorhodospira marina]
MNLCIIPARGGSKRIPRKNIKEFAGKPMIVWSIEAAWESGVFDQIIVSTDDDEIAAVASSAGAQAPFRRPGYLSDDHAGTTEVIAHATNWAQNKGWRIDAVCCLYATAPFVRAADINAGLETLLEGHWDFCFTATEFASPIFRAFTQRQEGGVEMFFPEHFKERSQDLPEALHDAGQFYWGRPEAWLQHRIMFGPKSKPLILPRWRVQDIDTEDDWKRAELLKPVIDRQHDI